MLFIVCTTYRYAYSFTYFYTSSIGLKLVESQTRMNKKGFFYIFQISRSNFGSSKFLHHQIDGSDISVQSYNFSVIFGNYNLISHYCLHWNRLVLLIFWDLPIEVLSLSLLLKAAGRGAVNGQPWGGIPVIIPSGFSTIR